MKKYLLSLLFIFSTISASQALEVKGQVSHPYSGGIFSNDPSDQDKTDALQAAKMAAWKQYVSTFNVSKQQQYQKVEGEVLKNIDNYITSYVVVAEDVNTSLKTLNLVIRANINENRLNVDLKGTTTAGTMDSGDGSLFSFVFVGREVTESKIFKSRETNIAQVDASSSAAKNIDTEGGASVDQSMSSSAKVSTGGNTVKKSSKDKHGIIATTDFDASFNEVLTGMGYETVDYVDVVSSCGGASVSAIKQAFSTSDELPQDLRTKAINGARNCEVKYFAVGYMNVSVPDVDPVSGEQRVVVSINGMVWNISKKLPRKVGSVGPVQYIGIGPDKDTARRNALKLAATSAAETISNQLGNKDLY